MAGGVELFVAGERGVPGPPGPQGSGAIAVFGAAGVTASATPRFLPPGYQNVTAPTTPVSTRVAIDQEIDAISFFCRVPGGGVGGRITYTLLKNGVPTPVEVTVPSGTMTAAFVAGAPVSFSAAAGDFWDILVTKIGMNTSPTDPMIMIGKT